MLLSSNLEGVNTSKRMQTIENTRFYSQAKEDQYFYDTYVKDRDLPFRTYLEMGALDGVKYSNTKFFDEELNWDGILIEPHPIDFKALASNRPRAKRYNKVVSDSSTPVMYKYFDNPNLSAVSGITSTLTEKNVDKFFESEDEWTKKVRETSLNEIELEPVTLDWVLNDAACNQLLLCSIDVEGHELNVLNSYSFDREIAFFLIEKNPNDTIINQLMSDNNYQLLGDVAHNNLFLHNDFKYLAH